MLDFFSEFIATNNVVLGLTTLVAGVVFALANIRVLLPQLGRHPTKMGAIKPVVMCSLMAAALWAYPAILSAVRQSLAPILPFASALLLMCWIVSMLLLATGIWLLLSRFVQTAYEHRA